MTSTKPVVSIDNARNDWLRLRTLILLRWLAVFGQIITVFVATQYFDLRLDLGLCLATIGLSLTANIVAIRSRPIPSELFFRASRGRDTYRSTPWHQ